MAGQIADFSEQVPISVGSQRVTVDAIGDAAFVVSDDVVYAFDGSRFRKLPAPPEPERYDRQVVEEIVVHAPDDVWLVSRPSGTNLAYHFDGTSWAHVGKIADGWSLIPLDRGEAINIDSAALICPSPWCHDSPPYGITRTTSWRGSIHRRGATGKLLDAGIPADLDGLLGYQGTSVYRAKSGRLGFVGCAFDPPPEPSNPNDISARYYGRLVAHEWDGSTLQARPLSNPPPCRRGLFAASTSTWSSVLRMARPLLDGTVVLDRGSLDIAFSDGERFLLMAP